MKNLTYGEGGIEYETNSEASFSTNSSISPKCLGNYMQLGNFIQSLNNRELCHSWVRTIVAWNIDQDAAFGWTGTL
jgi:hypothetical protein